MNKDVEFEVLKGKAFSEIIVNNEEANIVFICKDGTQYKMYHNQDCCEQVYIEDISGNLDDLLNDPILLAKEVSERGNGEYDTFTWTFYKLATQKAYVIIRWYGSSNGNYSESVSLYQIV